MCEILCIVLTGFLFFRGKVLDNAGVRGLTGLTINLFLPCLIFSHLIKNFNYFNSQYWWLYPVLGVVVSGVGFITARLLLAFDRKITQQKEFTCLVAFQNCGYLPLILAGSIFPAEISRQLFIHIFLFIQGFNLIFWSVGFQLLKPGEKLRYELKKIINPPFIALLISLILILSRGRVFIPGSVLRSVELVGACTLPVALISLGAILAGSLAPVQGGERRFIVKAVIGKLVIMPVIFMGVVSFVPLPKLMALLLIIEAAMPSAVNLSVLAFYQKTKSKIVSQVVLVTHICGLLTIPVFIGLYLAFMASP